MLAEPLLGRALVFGAAPGTPERPRFDGAPGLTAGDVIAPAAGSGALRLALVWGAAALVLPWLVRGRSARSTSSRRPPGPRASAAATIALGEWLGDRVGQAAPHGLVAGAVVAGAAAVALAHLRRPPLAEPGEDEP